MFRKVYSQTTEFKGTIVSDKVEVKEIVSGKNWKGKSARIRVSGADGMGQYIKLFGGNMLDANGNPLPPTVSFAKEKGSSEMITMTASQMEDQEFIKEVVPQFRRKSITIGGMTTYYVNDMKFFDDLLVVLKASNGKTINITRGELSFSHSKNNTYTEFSPQDVIIGEEIGEASFKAQFEAFFGKNALPEDIYNDNKIDIKNIIEIYDNKIPINVYAEIRNTDKNTKESVPDIYYPVQLTLNTSKLDYSNEEHLLFLSVMLNSFKNKTKEVFSVGIVCKFISGKETREYTEEELNELLTQEQKNIIKVFPHMRDNVLAQATGEKITGEFFNAIQVIGLAPQKPFGSTVEGLDINMLDIYKSLSNTITTTASTKEEDVTESVGVDANKLSALFS